MLEIDPSFRLILYWKRLWLDRFHDEELRQGRPVQGSFLPLVRLREVNRQVIWAYVGAVQPDLGVTFDIDAHLVETSKSDAKYCYEGYPAFQPIEVSWAETDLVLADEFREGNVPASKDIKRIMDEAYEQETMDHWEERGWEVCRIGGYEPSTQGGD